jgi:hypothetical protein
MSNLFGDSDDEEEVVPLVKAGEAKAQPPKVMRNLFASSDDEEEEVKEVVVVKPEREQALDLNEGQEVWQELNFKHAPPEEVERMKREMLNEQSEEAKV